MRRISHFFIRRPAKGNDRLFRMFPLVLVLVGAYLYSTTIALFFVYLYAISRKKGAYN